MYSIKYILPSDIYDGVSTVILVSNTNSHCSDIPRQLKRGCACRKKNSQKADGWPSFVCFAVLLCMISLGCSIRCV